MDDRLRRAAWRVLSAAAAAARASVPAASEPVGPTERAARGGGFGIDASGVTVPLGAGAAIWLEWGAPGEWRVGPEAPAAARPFLELYAPICAVTAARPLTIAHLGQSLDGHIATGSGDSYYVTGPDNVVHLHRLRALCDAVVVGAGTIERDDPQLTVRRVEGRNPVRVILDPTRRLRAEHRVFAGDAQTLLICGDDVAAARAHGSAAVVALPCRGGRLDLAALLAALHARGLLAVFVEGGGATVSSFLEAGLLDRLQIAIAPLVTGSGRAGLTLAARDRIAECLRPAHRVFTMGGDVLFDCDLRSGAATAPSTPAGDLTRIV